MPQRWSINNPLGHPRGEIEATLDVYPPIEPVGGGCTSCIKPSPTAMPTLLAEAGATTDGHAASPHHEKVSLLGRYRHHGAPTPAVGASQGIHIVRTSPPASGIGHVCGTALPAVSHTPAEACQRRHMTGIRGSRWARLSTVSPVRCRGLLVPACRDGCKRVCWEQRGSDARHIGPPTAPLCMHAAPSR